MRAAQEPDGYLYTFRTMHPDSPAHPWCGPARWESDPELSHELYNSGHLYEAGVAHFEATGRRPLLDICLRNAELLWREFGDGRRRLAPGHPIIEMGLVKLHRATDDPRWLTLARIFLEARGPGGPRVYQQHERVVDQAEAVGHAVRANYLYAGMADLAALEGDERYLAATGEARYADVFERATYNGFLSGVSLGGDRFFYPNPLAYDGVAKNNHGHAGRAPWFGCACCPPNVLRTLASFTSYFYAVRERSLYVNVYASSEAVVDVGGNRVRVTQLTDYPWSGRIRFELEPESPAFFALCLRLPGWARGEPVPSALYRYDEAASPTSTLRVNGQAVSAAFLDGYAVTERAWRAGDSVELELPMLPRRVRGHDRVDATRGRVALERGPLVYCVEQADAGVPLSELALPPRARVSPITRPDLLGGVTALRVENAHAPAFDAVPYHLWNNRGLAPMSVWLPAPPEN